MSDEKTSPKPELTVVGGQPSKRRHGPGGGKIKVPVGLEKLLFHAAEDTSFKKRFLEDPKGTVAETGVKLRPSELAMLTAISTGALESMIDSIVPENPRRRKFMGLVAAAAASLAAGTVEGCSGCDDAAEVEQPEMQTDGSTAWSTDPHDTEDTGTDTDTDTDLDGGMDAGPDAGK